jgi:hypothetical protein
VAETMIKAEKSIKWGKLIGVCADNFDCYFYVLVVSGKKMGQSSMTAFVKHLLNVPTKSLPC